ncbi:hypothetical protein MLD38_038786 [Melastoma candidum]|uniref:Uncharacterized protein n=1 Tax=Melastoma candidum TaxID=119954 RepID=A0ACB9L089_9MYRT|nr:hypothetical protein MLD38_038786 [Melastoma candidum]
MNSKERLLGLVILAVFLPAFVASDLIDDTCKVSIYNSELCKSILRSDSRSSGAKGPADLAIILLDQLDQVAQTDITRINTLIHDAIETDVKEALSSCNERYMSMVSQWFPFSRDSFTSGNTSLAAKYTYWASTAASLCEVDLSRTGSISIDINDFIYKVCLICKSIAESLMQTI